MIFQLKKLVTKTGAGKEAYCTKTGAGKEAYCTKTGAGKGYFWATGQSGGASQWRVCYQRGLPRLVFLFRS